MKKLLGGLLSVLLVFCFALRVNALSSSDTKLLNNIKSDVQSIVDNEIGEGQVTIGTTASGNTVTISLTGILEMSFNVTLKDNIITYSNASGDSNETLALGYILKAITDVDGNTLINNSSNYTFNENGLEIVASSGNITSLKVDAKNATLSGGYSSSTSTSTETTTEKTTETTENPKTGVFVPVVGLSVLIVASVVCLIWISKKNVFGGF